MATVQGARLTTNVSSDQIAIDLGKEISMLEPDVQVLSVFSRAAGKQATQAPKFYWVEDKHKARFDATSGAVASTTTTAIPVVTGLSFNQHDQVLVTRTGEQMRVDNVVGNTLTVTRGIGSTAANLNSGDELYIIGSSQPENDRSKPATSDNPVKTGNNTQIFRLPFEASGTLMATGSQINPIDWVQQNRKALGEHAKDIELSLLFSRKSATTPGSAEDRTTGGVLSFISTNQTDAGGDLSEAEWNAFMAQSSRYSSVNKLAMGSATAVSALNKYPASKQMTKNDETTYGMDVSHFTTPFGSVNLVYHRLLEGTKYGGILIVVDLDEVKYRYLAANGISRETKVLQNRQPNDQDGRKDEVLTECGLQFGQERKHGVITGITS